MQSIQPHTSYFSAGLGDGEKRTEPYKWYGEGASQPTTPPRAKSISRVISSADEQAYVVRSAG